VLFDRRRDRNGIDCRIGQRLGPIPHRHLGSKPNKSVEVRIGY
jgi:hypothetical protein